MLAGKRLGRSADDGIIYYYNSIGVAVQDAAAAETLFHAAVDRGPGQTISL